MEFSKTCLNSYLTASVALLALGACSGRNVSSSLVPAANVSSGHSGTHSRPHTTTTVNVGGPIVGMIAGGFTINGGTGCGYVHIYTNSSTTVSGPAPAVGLNAQVSGTGSCATSITAVTIATSSTSPVNSPSPVPIPAQTTVTANGPIVGLITGGFTINGGPGIGYMHVYTGSSTSFAGGTPKVGLYAQSTGTGSLATSVTASYVALYPSAPTSVTVTGVATSPTSYGFTANAGSTYPSVPIVMNKNTIVGGSPLVTGSTVKISGTGAQSETVLASSIVVSTPTPGPGSTPAPTPAPIAQKHVLTEDYLGSPWGTTSVAFSAAAPYL